MHKLERHTATQHPVFFRLNTSNECVPLLHMYFLNEFYSIDLLIYRTHHRWQYFKFILNNLTSPFYSDRILFGQSHLWVLKLSWEQRSSSIIQWICGKVLLKDNYDTILWCTAKVAYLLLVPVNQSINQSIWHWGLIWCGIIVLSGGVCLKL